MCKKKLKRTLDILVNANWVKESKCDVLQIFEELVSCELSREF